MEYTIPTMKAPDDPENLIFTHYLSLWLYCRKRGIAFKPKKVNLYQWTLQQ